jgi:hypothetical protein
MTPCQGMASPRHLQLWHVDTTTTTMRAHKHKGKLAIGSTLGPFLSIFIDPDTVTRSLPLHTIKGREGPSTEGRDEKKAMPGYGNVLSMHSNTQTHPLTETWEPSLSRTACNPLLQAPQCRATRVAACNKRRDVRPKPVYILCPPCIAIGGSDAQHCSLVPF